MWQWFRDLCEALFGKPTVDEVLNDNVPPVAPSEPEQPELDLPEPLPPTPDIVIGDPNVPAPRCRCNLEGENLRWVTVPVRYWVDTESRSQLDLSIELAAVRGFHIWGRASGLNHVQVFEKSHADIRLMSGPLDGMDGTLGVAYQPVGTDDFGEFQVMRPPFIGDIIIDTAEGWTQFDLENVVLHEVGHALGLAHIEDNEAVMNPFYLGAALPSTEDITEILRRYPFGQTILS